MSFRLYNLTELISSTPKNYDHSVGYHDIRPFNIDNKNLIALHRYPITSTILYKKKLPIIDICLWNFIENSVQKIDETNAWSWEQGARLQWISKNELIFNKFYENKLKACILNIKTNVKLYLDNPTYSIDKNNKKNLFINYSRLWMLWNTYGYNLGKNVSDIDPKPKDDGVFLSDFKNEKKLLLSIYDAVSLCGLHHINSPFFIAHPTFSPDGKKIVSLLRFTNNSGALISYLICTNIMDLKSEIIASERVSHFEWINNESLIVWSRNINKTFQNMRLNKYMEKYIVSLAKKIIRKFNSKIQTKILSTHFHLINLNNKKNIRIIDKDVLTVDGHPQISNCGRFLVNDTYPDINGYQRLMIHDLKKEKTHDVGEFKTANYLSKNNLKYDLHPRWSNDDKLINFDSSHEKSRQSYVVNVEKLLNRIQ